MRSRPIFVVNLILAGLVLLVGGEPSAAVPVRHSGTVVLLDPLDGVLVIDEIGPWRVARGKTIVTRRTIGLTPTTRFRVFIRIDVPDRYAGDFLEVALEATDIAPGDFVTAECVQARGRLVAVTVTKAEDDPSAQSPRP
jgi:hypothetical protein